LFSNTCLSVWRKLINERPAAILGKKNPPRAEDEQFQGIKSVLKRQHLDHTQSERNLGQLGYEVKALWVIVTCLQCHSVQC
jgi:hypothetical protein